MNKVIVSMLENGNQTEDLEDNKAFFIKMKGCTPEEYEAAIQHSVKLFKKKLKIIRKALKSTPVDVNGKKPKRRKKTKLGSKKWQAMSPNDDTGRNNYFIPSRHKKGAGVSGGPRIKQKHIKGGPGPHAHRGPN